MEQWGRSDAKQIGLRELFEAGTDSANGVIPWGKAHW